MRILATGGAGYVGSVCASHLLDKGHEVVVLDSLELGYRAAVDARAVFVKGCLSDVALLKHILQGGGFDAIMHFAAYADVAESMRHPDKYFRNNLCYGINLLDAAVAANVKKFVFSSSCAVYGAPGNGAITELNPTKPINPYGESKLFFERLLRWYGVRYKFDHVVLRYFNAAGATDRHGEHYKGKTRLIPALFRAALGMGGPVVVSGDDYPTRDGTCVRDYVHVSDLACAHEAALAPAACGVLNVGSGVGCSVLEVLAAAREVTGKSIPMEFGPRRPGDPPELLADISLARIILGYTPAYIDIKETLASAWRWLSNHPNGYPANIE